MGQAGTLSFLGGGVVGGRLDRALARRDRHQALSDQRVREEARLVVRVRIRVLGRVVVGILPRSALRWTLAVKPVPMALHRPENEFHGDVAANALALADGREIVAMDAAFQGAAVAIEGGAPGIIGVGRRAPRAMCPENLAVAEVEGVTPQMLVSLGEAGIKTLDDLAGCATDDLLGYYEVTKDKERVRVTGALEGFELTPDDANSIIMTARVSAGWIEAPVEAEAEEEEGEDTIEEEGA